MFDVVVSSSFCRRSSKSDSKSQAGAKIRPCPKVDTEDEGAGAGGPFTLKKKENYY